MALVGSGWLRCVLDGSGWLWVIPLFSNTVPIYTPKHARPRPTVYLITRG